MKKILLYTLSVLLILSCSSVSEEDSLIVEDFLIGYWQYNNYQQVPSKWYKNKVVLEIYKENEDLKFKWFNSNGVDFDGILNYSISNDNLVFEMLPENYEQDISENQKYTAELEVEGKISDENRYNETSFEEKIEFMKKQIEYRNASNNVMRSSKYIFGSGGSLMNQYENRRQNSNFSIDYFFDEIENDFYYTNGGRLEIFGFYSPYGGGFNSNLYYIGKDVYKDKSSLESISKDEFSYDEIMTLFEVISSKNKILDTNYVGWSDLEFKDYNAISDYDIRSVKLKGWNDIEEEFEINKSTNGGFEMTKVSFHIKRKNKYGRTWWESHEKSDYEKIYIQYYNPIKKRNPYSWLELKSVDVENKTITLGDNKSRRYMTLSL